MTLNDLERLIRIIRNTPVTKMQLFCSILDSVLTHCSCMPTHSELFGFSRDSLAFFADEFKEILLSFCYRFFHGLLARCRLPGT